MSNRRTGNAQVHSITSASAPLADDISRRARRYLFQMSLRTLCFLGAVVTWGRVPTWISVSMLVGAVILPYVAVVLANAGRERPERPDEFTHVHQLGTGPVGQAWSTGPTSPYEPTTVYEPSTFPVVDPFGPGTPGAGRPDASRDGTGAGGASRG